MKTVRFLVTLFVAIWLGAADKSALAVPTMTIKKSESTISAKEYQAYTAFAENKICVVAPLFGGVIKEINADTKYTFVKKGDVLATVLSSDIFDMLHHIHHYSSDDENDTNRSAAWLQKVYAKLDLLQIDKDDVENLLDLNKSLKSIKIRSQCDGIVVEKEISRGSAFEAKQKLFTIADNSTLWLEIKIYENDIQSVRVGQSVEVSINGYDKKIKTKIVRIIPEVNQKDRTVTARAIIGNPSGKIAANSFAKAKLISTSKRGIVLPKTALLERGGKCFVFLQNSSGKFEPLEVTAQKIDQNYIVTDGLNEGDKIATKVLFLLDADAKVQGLY